MIADWLGESVAAWLRKGMPPGTRDVAASSLAEHGHSVEQIAAVERVRGLGGILRRPVRREASAWICPRDNRLYSIWRIVPARAGDVAPKLFGTRLSCCRELTV